MATPRRAKTAPTPSGIMDNWPYVPPPANPTPNSSPVRASRHKGITNEVAYTSFTRRYPDSTISTFLIGSIVVVGPQYKPRQKWLQTPDHLVAAERARKARKAAPVQKGWIAPVDGVGMDEKIGIIVALFEDSKGKMMSRIRWFARPASVWGEEEPPDGENVEEFELYYTADSTYIADSEARANWQPGDAPRSNLDALKTPLCTDAVPLDSITGFANVWTPADFLSLNGPGNNHFMVRKVYDAKPIANAEFLGEIEWEDVLRLGQENGIWDTAPVMEEGWDAPPKPRKKSAKRKAVSDPVATVRKSKRRSGKRNLSDSDASDAGSAYGSEPEQDDDSDGRQSAASDNGDSAGEDEDEEDDEEAVVVRAAPVVPKRSKAAVARQAKRTQKKTKFHKKLETAAAVPPAFTESPDWADLSAFEKARQLLHVSATPESLPCRESQKEKIERLLGDAILDQTGTCLYIHGVPGTGKTATVHSVVRELQRDPDMEPFEFVEINGMKIADPSDAYSMTSLALLGKKLPPRQALTALEAYFQTPDPNRKTTVVLVDELDQMITKKQDVIYNYFNWPHIAHSRLIVIAVANTMDLPERELSGKIRSRLGSNRIPFPTYSWKDLETILLARLEPYQLAETVFGSSTIAFIAKKVATSSGDARRALDVARRTVEKRDQVNQAKKGAKAAPCSMDDVSETVKEMTNYGSNAFVKEASLHQKIFLHSVATCIKRLGTSEVDLDAVMHFHLDFVRQTSIQPVPTHDDLFAINAELHSLRLISSESARGDYFQRVRPIVADSELYLVLNHDPALKTHMPRTV